MLKWFKNLSDANKIAILVPVGLAAAGGLVVLFKWLSPKKDAPASPLKTIYQQGTTQTAGAIEGDKNIIAGGNVTTGIDSEAALAILVDTSARLGRSETENIRLRERIKQLEELLAQPQIIPDTGGQQPPQPTQEAKALAAHIEDDAGPYALALKAIATGNTKQADGLLDQAQQFLDTLQQRKDEAQAKIYIARMQNASYAGRPQDALKYCDKLTTLADNDSLIINEIAVVYYENAKYKEAEPLMKRAPEIDEASFGKDHPKVATDLNNLAQLYKATNRLKEAEPLMERALKIWETSLGKDHPQVAAALNNLAQLYKATNRLKEAEPLLQRALKIDEASFGKDHPNVARDLNNLAQLYQATNRLKKAEPMFHRVVKTFEKSLGENHPNVATALNNLALVYQATNRLKEAEPLMKRALKIDEAAFGKDHPDVATDLNNLATLYQATNRLKEAEPLMERGLVILLQFARRTGHPHPNLQDAINNYNALLMQMGHSEAEVAARLNRLAPEIFKSPNIQPKEE